MAEDIVNRVKGSAPVDHIMVAGSIRRRKETVNDIDILTTSKQPGKVMEVFTNLPHVSRVLMHGPTKSSVITDEGIQVDLRVVEEDSYGAALQYFTGSKQHNIKLRKWPCGPGSRSTSMGCFKSREGSGSGEKGKRTSTRPSRCPSSPPNSGKIPAKSKRPGGEASRPGVLEDIKGDLHVHTKWSDGSHDLDTMVQGARKKGYQYIAVTDHTKGLGIAHGLDETRLAEEIKLIDEANKKLTGFRILKGTEVDIRSDGSLDLSDEALSGLDIVVASVHSGFKQSREQITRRMLSAIRNPCVSIIAHPTGRLIGERDAYAIDMDAVLKEAARYVVAMEINAYPLRLDLNDLHQKWPGIMGFPWSSIPIPMYSANMILWPTGYPWPAGDGWRKRTSSIPWIMIH